MQTVKMEAKTFTQKKAAFHLESRNTGIHSMGDLVGTGLRFTTRRYKVHSSEQTNEAQKAII